MNSTSLKLMFRQLFRNRTYTYINLIGLAVALAAVLLIGSHVMKEMAMDCFHKNADRIYRLAVNNEEEGTWGGITTGPMGPLAREHVPGVKEFVRVDIRKDYRIKTEKVADYTAGNQCLFADRSFFTLFSFPIISGMPTDDPTGIVISRRAARKYFGTENPLGQKLYLKEPHEYEKPEKIYTVQAVMEDIPETSSVQGDFVISFSAIASTYDYIGCYGLYTFLLLDNASTVARIEQTLPSLISQQFMQQCGGYDPPHHRVCVQPLKQVYFGSGQFDADSLLRGSRTLTLILSGITLLILLLAACNYVMIRMACLNRNFGEYAIQRCYGAGNGHIRRQLLTEIAMQTLLALALAFILAFAVHPYFIQVISPGETYGLHLPAAGSMILVLLVLVFIITIGYALYFYTVRRLNREGIKNAISSFSGKMDLKRALTLVQMVIFAGLLFASVVLIRQMNYVKEKPLGYQDDHILNIEWRLKDNDIETIKSTIKRNPYVRSVSNGEGLPTGWVSRLTLYVPENESNKVEVPYLLCDDKYTEVYRIPLAEGRNIDLKDCPADYRLRGRLGGNHLAEVVVNQKLVQALQLKNPVGTALWDELFQEPRYRIVGVCRDFHFQPLYQRIQPVILIADMSAATSSFLVRYQPGKRAEVTDYLRGLYAEHFPNALFEPYEYRYSDWYSKDIALAKLIIVFTVMAILISGMGIFAFSIFMAENKRKEVALRKVNGAGEQEIIRLLNRGFVIRILFACALGVPVAWYAMQKWLEGFAYQVSLSGWTVLFVVTVCMLLVLSITSWQIWRAATTNPIDVIKRE